jgi:hypothetical protein
VPFSGVREGGDTTAICGEKYGKGYRGKTWEKKKKAEKITHEEKR